MKFSGIYQIQSKIKPERIYIGSAININKRWVIHLSALRRGVHHSDKLQRHFNKYGIADLTFSVIISCPKEDLIKTEQHFLDSYHPFFNTCTVAYSVLGIKRSDETKKKMSNALKGRASWNKGMSCPHEGHPHSEETKSKMGKSRIGVPGKTRGRKVPEEEKRKISKALIGRKLSQDSRRKISEALKGEKSPFYGTHQSKETRQKMRDTKAKNKLIKLTLSTN